MRTRWRPPEPPESVLKIIRTNEAGVEEIAFVGFVATTGISDGMADFRALAPTALLAGMPLPWDPPMTHQSNDRVGLEYWWRQIHYVFDLPDPHLFPALPSGLKDDEAALASRFVQTTTDLARSQLISFDTRFTFEWDKETKQPTVASAEFPGRDVQAGFAVLLRQCLSSADPANYISATTPIELVVEREADGLQDVRRSALGVWLAAVETVRTKSLEQLVRDRFVSEEGWSVFDYQEGVAPGRLVTPSLVVGTLRTAR